MSHATLDPFSATDRTTDGAGVRREVVAVTWGSYHVQVWREPNGSWSAAARDLDGAVTAGDSLAQIDRGMRESIAVSLDLPRGAENEMDLRTDISIDGGELDELAAHARQSRTAAEAATSAAERAAAALRQRGLSVRDVARLTGITAGRVSQLTRKHAA